MNIQQMVFSGVLVAMGILLPVVFHAFGGMGAVFLPMHIPVLLAGLLFGPAVGLAVGICTPFASSLLTGMPPFLPIMPIMMTELACYGLLGGYLYRVRRLPLLLSLLLSMICGRLAAGGAVYLLVSLLHIKLSVWPYLSGAVVTGAPGMLLQIIILPFLVRALEPVLARQGVVKSYV